MKGKVSSFSTLKISCEQLSFCIGIGSSPLTRQMHEEHNDIHCDLPNTFSLDEFSFKARL